MKRARQTRRELLRQIDKIELGKPFVFYTVILAAMHFALIRTGSATASLTQKAAFLIAGLLSWGLYEYSVHRWVLHSETRGGGFNLPGNLTHLKHHADPQSLERLNVQLTESTPVCIVYCLLARIIAGSWQATVYLFTGFILGYFFYEYLDYQAHYGASSARPVRYFRNYHLLHHHYNATVRYGVTSPLFDHLFGTFHLQNRKLMPGEGHEGQG